MDILAKLRVAVEVGQHGLQRERGVERRMGLNADGVKRDVLGDAFIEELIETAVGVAEKLGEIGVELTVGIDDEVRVRVIVVGPLVGGTELHAGRVIRLIDQVPARDASGIAPEHVGKARLLHFPGGRTAGPLRHEHGVAVEHGVALDRDTVLLRPLDHRVNQRVVGLPLDRLDIRPVERDGGVVEEVSEELLVRFVLLRGAVDIETEEVRAEEEVMGDLLDCDRGVLYGGAVVVEYLHLRGGHAVVGNGLLALRDEQRLALAHAGLPCRLARKRWLTHTRGRVNRNRAEQQIAVAVGIAVIVEKGDADAVHTLLQGGGELIGFVGAGADGDLLAAGAVQAQRHDRPHPIENHARRHDRNGVFSGLRDGDVLGDLAV